MNLAATGEVKMNPKNPDHDPHDEARYQGRSQIWLQQEVIHYECEGILGILNGEKQWIRQMLAYSEGFLPTCAGQTNMWKGRFFAIGLQYSRPQKRTGYKCIKRKGTVQCSFGLYLW